MVVVSTDLHLCFSISNFSADLFVMELEYVQKLGSFQYTYVYFNSYCIAVYSPFFIYIIIVLSE